MNISPVTRAGNFLILTENDLDVGIDDPTGLANFKKAQRIVAKTDDEQQLLIAYVNFDSALKKGMDEAKNEIEKLENRLSDEAIKFAKMVFY